MSNKKEEIIEEGVKKTTENKTVGQASTISGGNKTTTTTTEPTIKRRQSTSWRYNPTTGETNTELVDSFNENVNRYASANQIDTTTGKTDRKQLSSLLGFDPQVNKKRREEQEAIARRKQKEAALFNGLSVLGDMLTTAIGGNVEKRDAYEGGSNAAKELEKLREEQAAEDTLIGTTINKNDNNYLDYINKLEKDYQKLFGVTQEVSTQGSKTQTTSVGDKTISKTTNTTTDKAVKGDGRGTGSRNKIINVLTKDKGTQQYEVTAEQYKAITNLLKSHYTQLMQKGFTEGASDKDNKVALKLEDELIDAGIIKKIPTSASALNENPRIQYEWNDELILQNGKFFSLTEDLEKQIREKTGGKIKFVHE